MGGVEDKLAVWRTLAVDGNKGVLCVMSDIVGNNWPFQA